MIGRISCLALLALAASSCASNSATTSTPAAPCPSPSLGPTEDAPPLTVQSTAFSPNGPIPAKHSANVFGCTGENISPDLSWSGEPPGTKSFAVIVHDPDAPTGVGFFHWVVANIPATTHSLPEGLKAPEPPMVFGFTDYGNSTYGGPCPPPGAPHRYNFEVYALDVDKLPVEPTTTGATLRFLVRGHTLARGVLTGTFAR